jgi:hypothetical protein
MHDEVLLLYGGSERAGLLHSGDQQKAMGGKAARDVELAHAVAAFANTLDQFGRRGNGTPARAKQEGPSEIMPFRSAERDVLMLHGGAQETVLRTQVAKPTGIWAPPRHPWEWCAEIGHAKRPSSGSLFVDLATQTCCCLSLQELLQSCACGGAQTHCQCSNPCTDARI